MLRSSFIRVYACHCINSSLQASPMHTVMHMHAIIHSFICMHGMVPGPQVGLLHVHL